MTTIQRTGRALVTAVVALFAAFLAIEPLAAPPAGAAADVSAAAPVGEADPVGSHRVVKDTWGERGEDAGCEGRRAGRGPLTAPAPSGKPSCVCGCDAAATDSPARGVVPRAARQTTVPVSRSGELAVALQTFRC
ncbi:hypothetical protein [Streptomyces sp. XD-27]|uniref:hypothetical protein n=1 Tax=Streptomyces sp. XD-27 TaxID=3062779 RepID=UPI0026F42090|nr:hypothetical protein [Streptomyces sp. XD-27]WKX71842.1 hypothetical protein Q3Y56_19805 [Streptomyces sp. XD-27]